MASYSPAKKVNPNHRLGLEWGFTVLEEDRSDDLGLAEREEIVAEETSLHFPQLALLPNLCHVLFQYYLLFFFKICFKHQKLIIKKLRRNYQNRKKE